MHLHAPEHECRMQGEPGPDGPAAAQVLQMDCVDTGAAPQGVVDPLDGRVIEHAVTYPEVGAIPLNADRQRIRRGTDRRGESQPSYEVHPHGRVGHARGRIGSKTSCSASADARRMQF